MGSAHQDGDSAFQERYKETLSSLERYNHGRIYLSVKEFARASGLSAGTIYNQISLSARKGIAFPIPVVRLRNRPFFRIHDVARFLADLPSEGLSRAAS
jgi:predicted DNA-binding transcriptional regulator AlpA